MCALSSKLFMIQNTFGGFAEDGKRWGFNLNVGQTSHEKANV